MSHDESVNNHQKRADPQMNITTVGLDIAKSVFHFYAVNRVGKLIKKKVLKRSEVILAFQQLEPCTVVMESCGSANYWAREIQNCGHEVKLIAPQYVVPYRRKNKNDFNDAEAIAEASQRDNMNFVPIKSISQQDIQMLLRVRSRYIECQCKLSNQIRGLLAEYGLATNEGKAALRRFIPDVLEDANNGLSESCRSVFSELYQDLIELDEKVNSYDKKISIAIKPIEICQRAQTVIGIGPITAASIYAAIGSGENFKNGRHFAAWCGLVPRQHSTGGKTMLSGITKRGNSYLRMLLVHGARTTLQYTSKKEDKLSLWAERLKIEKGYNKACVALANKLARIVWSVITSGKDYQLMYGQAA
jgi:transposase